METTKSIALLVAVLSLFSITLLLMNPTSTAAVVVCNPDTIMTIQSGKQLSIHCINTPQSGFDGKFYRKNELDARRYAIAQRQWDYGAPPVEQNLPFYFNNDVRQYE